MNGSKDEQTKLVHRSDGKEPMSDPKVQTSDGSSRQDLIELMMSRRVSGNENT